MNEPQNQSVDLSLEDIFAEAIQIASPGERAEFVDKACGSNAKLRKNLERLLNAHDCEDALFDSESDVADSILIDANTPERFGEFEIIREIGRGGMGIVYEAQQESLKRRVALKVLFVGADFSKKAIARFHCEAEAAARLHHTNIVPIHTTGE